MRRSAAPQYFSSVVCRVGAPASVCCQIFRKVFVLGGFAVFVRFILEYLSFLEDVSSDVAC